MKGFAVTLCVGLLGLLLLTSCGNKAPPISDEVWSRVVVVEIEDGTRCAVAETRNGHDVSISCDWQ